MSALGVITPSGLRIVAPKLAQLVRQRQQSPIARAILAVLRPNTQVLCLAVLMAVQILVLIHGLNLGLGNIYQTSKLWNEGAQRVVPALALIWDHANWLTLSGACIVILLSTAISGIVRFWLATRVFLKVDVAVRSLQPMVESIDDAAI
jgi:hypothetical protein